MLVGLVVFIFPAGAAAVTAVAGDGDRAAVAQLFAVGALHQFGMTGRTAPIALDARARLAKHHFFQFILDVLLSAHGQLSVGHEGLAHRDDGKNPRKKHFVFSYKVLFGLVGPAGVEPTTNGLKVRCSTN